MAPSQLAKAARAREHVERVVGVVEELQRRARAELGDQRLQQAQIRQLVARALQKEHRHVHVEEVLRALVRRLARRMQREAKEGEADHAGQRAERLRLRGHAAAEGLAAGDERQPGQTSCRFGHRRAHRGMRGGGRIGALAAALHVRELVAQGRDAALGQALCDLGHEGMRHARTGAVREDVPRACAGRGVEHDATKRLPRIRLCRSADGAPLRGSAEGAPGVGHQCGTTKPAAW